MKAPEIWVVQAILIFVSHLLLNIKIYIYIYKSKKNYVKSILHCVFSLNCIKKAKIMKKETEEDKNTAFSELERAKRKKEKIAWLAGLSWSRFVAL